MTQESDDALPAAQSEAVQEFVQSTGRTLRVDAGRGVLRGVKLLGLRSRNGRRYEEGALAKSIGLYEGAKVNVNHPARDPLAPRDYRDRLGVVRNVRMEAGAGLFGDLHYNPSHTLAEQLAWDAEHAPENVGLSHNVLARTRREAGEVVVEAITRVQSVDLVADPATTSGLFEQEGACGLDREAALREEVAELRERLAHAEENAERERRRRRIEELLREQGVSRTEGDLVLGESFQRRLMEAPEDELASLVAEHARLARGEILARRPRSREQPLGRDEADQGADTASFVSAITRRR